MASPGIATSGLALWSPRVERAHALQSDYPAAAHLLRFYAQVLVFQGRIAAVAKQTADTTLPLKDQLDLAPALSAFPDLLKIARTHGPTPLAEAAVELEEKGNAAWREIINAGTGAPARSGDAQHRDVTPQTFFARACQQPIAEHLQSQFPPSTDQSARLCPACGSLPQLIILRPEGEGARRSLLCSFCLLEWQFRRLLCPYCGEESKDKLPFYTAEECNHVRVEACDTCLHYLKSVDLSLNGLAVPLVDELALTALDLWAADRGYRKIIPNLLGL